MPQPFPVGQSRRRGEDRLAGDDGTGARDGRNSVHRTATSRITFQAVGGTVCGTVVEERIQVGRVEINSEAAADHEVAVFPGFVGESQSWSKIPKVLWIYAGDARTLEDQTTFAGNKNGKIFFVVAERAFIVPTNTVIHGEFAVDLPGILSKECKCFYEGQARGITQGDTGAAWDSNNRQESQRDSERWSHWRFAAQGPCVPSNRSVPKP